MANPSNRGTEMCKHSLIVAEIPTSEMKSTLLARQIDTRKIVPVHIPKYYCCYYRYPLESILNGPPKKFQPICSVLVVSFLLLLFLFLCFELKLDSICR